MLQPVPDDDVSMEDCALATATNDVEKTKQQLPLPRPRLPPRHGSVPQALVATTEQKACPKGHVLVQFRDSNYYSYGVTCDRCCRQAIKSPEHVWRCETCNWDLCQKCYAQALSSTHGVEIDAERVRERSRSRDFSSRLTTQDCKPSAAIGEGVKPPDEDRPDKEKMGW